jgi:hypothetical protein
MNASVEVPSDVKADLAMGQTIFKKERFEHLEAPIFTVMIGQGLIDPEVTADMVLNGFQGIVVVGHMVVPEALEGALQSRIRMKMGLLQTYPVLKQTQYGNVELSERWLQTLEDGAEICVLGKLAAPDVVSNELLVRKLKRLFVLEGISIHEENAAALQGLLVTGSGKMSLIPAGFMVIEKPLRLDLDLIEALPARKLSCKEVVQIDPEVPAQLLDERLDAIRSDEMILCPTGLRSVLVKKCDLLNNQVVFYEGLLWLVKD